ncbi:A disintegrin and metalloproteinase with thrombospondin motifs gon-1-like isoform X2 [Mya arenaria]|uniref:A disintegrin and metalloproteinase with thrombospondin motifs gon-1-like isoform X2 n=1 Tax=Mya arenaria TaxID=6604 RepID=UPI0022E5FEF1|nr:A disintegrin and metalloproteinase with thrombospondin motifs gon-1-like isoform X2 [Mya arenaria]
MDVKFIFRTVLATCFVSGIVHGSFCNLPAVSMCTTASVVGNANQIVYLDSSTAPTFQLTECVCELRFELSGTISLSYRPSAPTMDNSCGVQFKYDRPNASPYTFGCSEMTSGTNVQTRTFANITFTKSLDSFRSWFSCVGIQPAPGKSVTVSCYPDVNYISPESGGWTGWGSWTECTSTCSTGTIRRTRDCNGTSCDGQSTQTRECENVQNCPVNGDWSGWTDWNECSVSCGTGSKTRNRNCDNPPPSGGGDACLGDSSESEVCNLGSCTQNVDGGWGLWSVWSACSVSCGGGSRSRARSCDNPTTVGEGLVCLGENGQRVETEITTEQCNLETCSVNGGWRDWSDWTSCSVTCGGGVRSRSRSCDNPKPVGEGLLCVDVDGDRVDTETRSEQCNLVICPVNGGWGLWLDWSTCSVSCGGGVRSRSRSCNDPTPVGEGRLCVDADDGQEKNSDFEAEACNTAQCIENQNGGWSTWIRTSDCTVTCGGGFAVWTRSCDNPIQTGSGQPCVDERGQEAMSETKQLTCNHLACPASVNGGWTPWTNYGTCSVTCGGGTQERSRECENPAPQGGGAACSGGDGQEQAESRDCGVDECPADKSVNGGWSPWTNYRACSVTCGGGTQERSRKCESPAPQGDGEACSGGDGQEQTESRGCGEDECPADNTETPVAGAAVGTSGDDTNIAAIVGGIIGTLVALLLIILLIICLVRRRRREKKPEKRPGPRSIRYDSQGGDVTVTENELYQYDGETPAHATNALFIGGIPDTPSSPGYIPHFSTDNGSQYAVIMDSTRAKDRPNERPSLETFSASKKSTDSETSLKTPETIPPFENGDVRPFVEPNHYVDSNPDLGVDNPGYFNATGGEGSSPTSKSPYDYIDHDKLKKDDAEFENAFDDASSNEFNGYPESQADESHYKRFISSDGSEVANDGYLTSPKRDNTFEFSSPNDS